jgi:DNA-binding transcriptional MerR regulator
MPSVKGYSLKEVANKVGVTPATILRWIETGKFRVPKRKNAQGHYFFTEVDLRHMLSYRDMVSGPHDSGGGIDE